MFRDDVINQVNKIAGEYIEDQTYKHRKRRKPFAHVSVPRAWYQATFGNSECGFVCIENGAVEVRPHDGPVELFFDEKPLRFI